MTCKDNSLNKFMYILYMTCDGDTVFTIVKI